MKALVSICELIGLIVTLPLTIYFLPWVIARKRGHKSAGGILVLNLFLGWTFLFWVLALVWSFTGNTDPSLEGEPLIFAPFIGGVTLTALILFGFSSLFGTSAPNQPDKVAVAKAASEEIKITSQEDTFCKHDLSSLEPQPETLSENAGKRLNEIFDIR